MEAIHKVCIDGHEILLSAVDADILVGRTWRVLDSGGLYVRWSTTSKGKREHHYLHRMVAAAKRGEIVDHINRNPLDNRRSNLRIVDKAANARNRTKPPTAKSRFNGVGWSTDRWQVSIRHDGKQLYIGRFVSEIEAAYNYDLASLKYHGEYGSRNFLPFVV